MADNWTADKPQEDPNIRGDAFKTLMVSRLSYQATEEDLEREFGRIGAIERVRAPISASMHNLLTILQIRIVKDTHADEKPNKKKKPHRGYAFIVFEREKDMRGNAAIDISTHIPSTWTRRLLSETIKQDRGPQACLSCPFSL